MMSRALRQRGEASELFARDRGEGLATILGTLEQTMFGDPLYKTREERAAHLLYFVIKNHPFADGNKRSGAFLFLLYLRQEGMHLTFQSFWTRFQPLARPSSCARSHIMFSKRRIRKIP
jgi:prophage maintenance system killer protein